MEVLKFIFIILEVLVLFNLLIFVHELGHFLAAKWRGLKVERFAIWFGKPIWKKTIGGVEYMLGTIPAGGYVSLPQMAPMDVIEGKTDQPREQLPPISALDKIIVAFAGPVFSFGLALVFALVVFWVGRPVSEAETSRVIGAIDKDSPAEKAGLRVGDEIVKVDGKPVTKFLGMGSSVNWRIVRSEGDTIPIEVKRGNEALTVNVTPIRAKTKAWQRKALRQILIAPAYTLLVNTVLTNSPGAAAGLQRGDQITEVNGEKLFHPAGFIDYVNEHGTAPLNLKVMRNGKTFDVAVKPEIPEGGNQQKPRVGVAFEEGGLLDLAKPGVVEQIYASVDAMVSTFGALFSRKSDISAQHLSGFVKIMNIYYVLFESEQGWRLALWFSVIMNVNLAILNLLPIPVLDGGHIVLAIIEGVRRKPVSVRLLQVLQTSCAVLIIGYMLYIAFYDVQELPWNRKSDKPPEIKFAPKPEPGAIVPAPAQP
jgi:regulator of sigma E protease